jgi:hypothetical protein
MKRVLVAVAVLVSIVSSSAFAADAWKGPNHLLNHTGTWWCLDLNELFRVDLPIIIGRGNAIAPVPSPVADPCTSTFPHTVPNGSQFVVGGGVIITNKTYPSELRAELQQLGYNFHSQSPADDFMSKIVDVRVEVRTDPGNTLVATYHFDPRRNVFRMQWRDWGNPTVQPDFDVDISADELERLPAFTFPVIAGPVSPGTYRSRVYWTLSEAHNDGLGAGSGDFLPAGDTLLLNIPFVVLP